MAKRVAINGFGRIGRLVARHLLKRPGFELVAVNDLSSAEMLGYLFKMDSVHGKWPGTVEVVGDSLVVDGNTIKVLAQKDPSKLPWKEFEVDYVFEATGIFRTREKASQHIEAGAKRVVITAPAKGEVDATFVFGVNHEKFDPNSHFVVSNASCTTNCLAPMVKVLAEHSGIAYGWLTTIHAYTNDQRILDVQHPGDFRRARAAAVNIIPTSTGAAKAIGLVIPELAGKLDGAAMRVPVSDGSVCDLIYVPERATTTDSIKKAFQEAAQGALNGILAVSSDPLVSSDVIGETHSCVVDMELIKSVGDNLFRVVGWYDNENAYSLRCVDLLEYIAGMEE